jgi:hypothetical protein
VGGLTLLQGIANATPQMRLALAEPAMKLIDPIDSIGQRYTCVRTVKKSDDCDSHVDGA